MHEQQVLPHPDVHLAFEETAVEVHGVDRKLFVRRIEGRGKVLGVRFRPGGFHPFWKAPVSQLNDCVIPVRRLQRLFAEYAGVSPKWVMRRARLHEAAERAGRGAHVDWAALSADLGYADQAHLTWDFTATIGVPPARYACG